MALLSVITALASARGGVDSGDCPAHGLSRNTIRKYLASNGVEPRIRSATARASWIRMRRSWRAGCKREATQGRKQRRNCEAVACAIWCRSAMRAPTTGWRPLPAPGTATAGVGADEPGADVRAAGVRAGRGVPVRLERGLGRRSPASATKLQVAHFKLCHSRAFLLRAYPLQTHEMLFDAHNHAFRCWAACRGAASTTTCRPPSTRSAAARSARSTPALRAMVSHYLFEAEFCIPASGWEKGQIEKNVQDARHRLWHDGAGVPALAALNDWLEHRCMALWQEDRHPEQPRARSPTSGRTSSRYLMPLPRPFDGFVEHTKRVSPTCLVHFERNRYSVPASFANRPVSLRVYPERLVVAAEGQVDLRASRASSSAPTTARPHGLRLAALSGVIQRKPGALRNGAPFAELPGRLQAPAGRAAQAPRRRPGDGRDPRPGAAARRAGRAHRGRTGAGGRRADQDAYLNLLHRLLERMPASTDRTRRRLGAARRAAGQCRALRHAAGGAPCSLRRWSSTLKSLKLYGMAQAVGELREQGAPAFQKAQPDPVAAAEGRDGRPRGALDRPTS